MNRLRYQWDCLLLALPPAFAVACYLSGHFWAELKDGFIETIQSWKAQAQAAARFILSRPEAFGQAWIDLPWHRWLSVRRGFLYGAMMGFFVAGSMLWAIPEVSTYFPHVFLEPIIPPSMFMPSAHEKVPSELAWFFIQFPYISESARIIPKNRHTFVVSDAPRHRNYVINFGQRYRRVEIYSQTGESTQVHIFTPGSKRVVFIKGAHVEGKFTRPDGNLWMWKGPLWNMQHLKIYGQADMWLDSPYKKYSCAGFVHRFLKDAQVDVPILDAWDMARLPWVRVPVDELEPGDILTFKALTARHRRFWGHQVTHVGVYIGNGKMIHASTASENARRSWVRIAEVQDWRKRIDKIIRPPEML